jgi:uncharacterized protein (TIGR02466 family)
MLCMLFAAPLFVGHLPDLVVCDLIEQKLRALQETDKGKWGGWAWMSNDDLHLLPEMKELVDLIMVESTKVLDIFAVKRDSHYISNMWANITPPNHRQATHVHPNCFLSGLVYIATPDGCGPTMFVSPRRLTSGFEPEYTYKNELNSDFMLMPAEKGKMLIWPSYLAHGAEPATIEAWTGHRIAVSFNIMIRGSIELFTANLNL